MAKLEVLQAQYDVLVKERKEALVAYRKVVAEAKARNAEIKALQEQIRKLQEKVRWENKHTIAPDDDLGFVWKRTPLPPKGNARNRETQRRDWLKRLLWKAYCNAIPDERLAYDEAGYVQWAKNTHLHEINRLIAIPWDIEQSYWCSAVRKEGMTLGDYAKAVANG